jgi:hypothetical protein
MKRLLHLVLLLIRLTCSLEVLPRLRFCSSPFSRCILPGAPAGGVRIAIRFVVLVNHAFCVIGTSITKSSLREGSVDLSVEAVNSGAGTMEDESGGVGRCDSRRIHQ